MSRVPIERQGTSESTTAGTAFHTIGGLGNQATTQEISGELQSHASPISALHTHGNVQNQAGNQYVDKIFTGPVYYEWHPQEHAVLREARHPDVSINVHDLVREGRLHELASILDQQPFLLKNRDMQGRTPLHIAAQGHLKFLSLLLSKSDNLDIGDYESNTPLHLAAISNSPDCIRVLIRRGANLNALNDRFQTPIQCARQHGEETEMLWVLKYGADIDARNEQDETALIYYSRKGDLEMAKHLLKLGADVHRSTSDGRDALLEACRNGHAELVDFYLHAGANVNGTTQEGDTALIQSARLGHLNIVNILLATVGVDINYRNHGSSCLTVACTNEHDDVAVTLLNAGVEIDVPSTSRHGTIHQAAIYGLRQTAIKLMQLEYDCIHWRGPVDRDAVLEASNVGNSEMVKIFMDGGADPNSTDEEYNTPLHLATQKNYSSVVKVLLETGKIYVNARNKRGWTPLIEAIYNTDMRIVQILLSHGADANVAEPAGDRWTPLMFALFNKGTPNRDALAMLRILVQDGNANINARMGLIGETVLLRAIQEGLSEVAEGLITLGADPRIKSTNPTIIDRSNTPPICMAATCMPSIIPRLVEAGANVDEVTKQGWTALHIAADQAYSDLVKVLLELGADRQLKTYNTAQTPYDLTTRFRPSWAITIQKLLKYYWPNDQKRDATPHS